MKHLLRQQNYHQAEVLITRFSNKTFSSLKPRTTGTALFGNNSLPKRNILMKNRNYHHHNQGSKTSMFTTLFLIGGASVLIQSYINTTAQQNQAEASQDPTLQQSRVYDSIQDDHFVLGQKKQRIFIFYDSKNALHNEFLHEVEIRQTINKILKRYQNAEVVLIDLNKQTDTENFNANTQNFLDLLEVEVENLKQKKSPTVYFQADDRIAKIKANLLNENYNDKFNIQFQKEASFYNVNSIKDLADRLQQFNTSLSDVTIVYCNAPSDDASNDSKKAREIGFRLIRHDTENPILQVNDKELAEKMNMQPGKFYCYYKPSFINGYEQYIEKDINFNYLQAYEGVCRDEFTLNTEYIGSEEFQTLLSKHKGFYTYNFSQSVFDQCFSRTFNVEFFLDPNFKNFKQKFQKGTAQKPMIFIYSPPLYMSRYVGEFKEALKNYQEVFDVYYTDDEKEASQVFYTKEFPEIFPYVAIIDTKKKKALKSEDGTLKELTLKNNNFYFQKYREIIFFNEIQKNMTKLIDKFLDGEVHHFYQSEKMQQQTRVKKICTANFEDEILKNPQVTQCLIEVFKHDCPSCSFNGKVFNAFSRKLEKHNYLNKLPCYRLAIDNKVPFLGNFGYSPIYFYVKKRGDQIVELKTLEPPQKSPEFLQQVQEYSKLKGFKDKIKLKARDQIIKHIKLEDLEEDFDIDFDTKEEEAQPQQQQQ